MRDEFLERQPNYDRLGRNVRDALEEFVLEAAISALSVSYRVKTYDSFIAKKERKKYKDPFKQTTDLCGVRIVVFYPSDIDAVDSIIQREFEVVEQNDKQHGNSPDKFGYRSNHYLLKLKNSWINAPNYRGLNELIFEVQLRTILMHAWADISHQLAYKEVEHIPIQFQREINQLSALLEVADGVIDRLRADRTSYRNSLTTSEGSSGNKIFDVNAPLNSDSLSEFLDFYFKDRKSDVESTLSLYVDLKNTEIGFKEILEGYDRLKKILPSLEDSSFKSHSNSPHDILEEGEEHQNRWAQVGIVRHILDLTNEKWWTIRLDELPDYVIEEKAEQSRIVSRLT